MKDGLSVLLFAAALFVTGWAVGLHHEDTAHFEQERLLQRHIAVLNDIAKKCHKKELPNAR